MTSAPIPAAHFAPHLPFTLTSQHFLSLFVKCWVYGGRVWGKPLLQLRLALVLFKTDWKLAPLELRGFVFCFFASFFVNQHRISLCGPEEFWYTNLPGILVLLGLVSPSSLRSTGPG